MALQNLGSFWSLSLGADFAKAIRELGGLYDRALRYHASRVAVAVTSNSSALAGETEQRLKSLRTACDRTLVLSDRQPISDRDDYHDSEEDTSARSSDVESPLLAQSSHPKDPASDSFSLRSPDVWETILAAILGRKQP